jgi:hypothetical protein
MYTSYFKLFFQKPKTFFIGKKTRNQRVKEYCIQVVKFFNVYKLVHKRSTDSSITTVGL